MKAQGSLVFMEVEDMGSGGWLALHLGHLESVFGAVVTTPGLSESLCPSGDLR